MPQVTYMTACPAAVCFGLACNKVTKRPTRKDMNHMRCCKQLFICASPAQRRGRWYAEQLFYYLSPKTRSRLAFHNNLHPEV